MDCILFGKTTNGYLEERVLVTELNPQPFRRYNHIALSPNLTPYATNIVMDSTTFSSIIVQESISNPHA